MPKPMPSSAVDGPFGHGAGHVGESARCAGDLVPALRDPPLLTMGDMGMDHGSGSMDHGVMTSGPSAEGATGGATGAMDHAAMGHGDVAASPIVAWQAWR